MTRAWRSIYIAALLYAAFQILLIAWAIPTLLEVAS
jgi:hypothetical protein